ncbi:MAG: Crp/Fnr family transcriptional regulator [Dehalococcoidia bacterium]|jgi:CRP/FNR family transcriptional regulator|nr:Crp/Fnr family transcriptional regulator [Dehalococcoidia bacterium]MDP6510675.1 Crp/Fnr family transcriptional regulator [Dehalococcoidia bacterium]MDP6782610.1 Crp/Fnr family transcriptional regulator [Dehalococcoidia bacterium]
MVSGAGTPAAELSELLSHIPYFHGLSQQEMDTIKPFFFGENYDRQEVIVLEGEPCKAVYFVASGSVKVIRNSPEGRELVLRIMRKDETFNEVPVFDGGPNPATVVALEPIRLYAIPVDKMGEIIRLYPQVAMNILRIFGHRLRQMVTLAEDLSFRHVMGRLAKVLLENVVDREDGPRLTQQDMAAMVGTAREMVSRSLRSLEDMGAIKSEGRSLRILNPDLLRDLL